MSVQITTDEFRKPENRFVFQGGSQFATSLADTIDQLQAAARVLADERDRWYRLASKLEVEARQLDHERDKLQAGLAAARAECEEQARLNGMGAERELKLQTDLAAARGLLNDARAAGIYRAYHETTSVADRIDAFLAGKVAP